ncbi:MAG TPA: serine/threonine-protein kinase [Gemmatales bacterium]|nr:serine/threonine-protein kinase [Gemmatales bacterium]HMP58668.1 serine/threonine-protein kinase [Gemmatales bacterium]
MLSIGMEACPGYRLTKRLGQGGFGDVWEGSSPDGRKFALKFLDIRHQPPGSVATEIKLLLTLRDLKHPNLIQLENIVTLPNAIVLIMELADGSLHDLHYVYRQDYKSNIPPQVLCNLLGQAAAGLDFMAVQRLPGIRTFSPTGLQHCDVKPSNLLLSGKVVKVVDFGLSGPKSWGQGRNVIMGTPPYAAPELYEGKPGERTDQFGLAVSYYELRTGKLPYEVPKELAFPAGGPDLSLLPESERQIVGKALSRRWLDRWPSCTDFMKALTEAIEKDIKAVADAERQAALRKKPASSASHIIQA